MIQYLLLLSLLFPLRTNALTIFQIDPPNPTEARQESWLTSPEVNVAGNSEQTTGVQKLAVVLVDFLDSGPRPFTREQASTLVLSPQSQFQKFYADQSYNQISFTGQIADWQQLPRSGLVNGNCRWPGYQNNNELNTILVGSGIDLHIYNRVIILANHPCLQGGLSTFGSSNFTINGQTVRMSLSYIGSLDIYNEPSNRGPQPFAWTNLDRLLSHEFGHSLNLRHSNGLDCYTSVFGDVGINCSHVEYGNAYDVMGGLSGGGYTLHFNAYQKELLGWLPPEKILNITTSGRYTISPLERNRSSSHAAKVLLPDDTNGNERWLYLETRQPLGFDANLATSSLMSNIGGLMVNVLSRNSGAWYTRLLDLSPTTDTWLDDIKQTALNPIGSREQLAPGLTAASASLSALLAQADQQSQAGSVIQQVPDIMLGPVVSASITATTFDIGVGDNPCFVLPPTIGPAIASPSGSNHFNSNVTNQDYFGCQPADFSITVQSLPVGWTATATPNLIPNLIPRTSQAITLMYATPAGTSVGSYPLEIKATNLETDLSATRVFTVRIN